MATQSADVERACKVHKVVHTKSRNRLTHELVTDLVYCYVNLRLLKKVRPHFEGKPLDGEDNLEDYLGSALDRFEEEAIQEEQERSQQQLEEEQQQQKEVDSD